ncbi:hypothetical protein, partial [Paenibacillus odorifer]|uniref:hypothetical protein n=1 Tax=Paenibacillus odorifer TaxID=189426 RepID=UPI001C4D6926
WLVAQHAQAFTPRSTQTVSPHRQTCHAVNTNRCTTPSNQHYSDRGSLRTQMTLFTLLSPFEQRFGLQCSYS